MIRLTRKNVQGGFCLHPPICFMVKSSPGFFSNFPSLHPYFVSAAVMYNTRTKQIQFTANATSFSFSKKFSEIVLPSVTVVKFLKITEVSDDILFNQVCQNQMDEAKIVSLFIGNYIIALPFHNIYCTQIKHPPIVNFVIPM